MDWRLKPRDEASATEIYVVDLSDGGALEVYNVGKIEPGWFWQRRKRNGQVIAGHTYPFRLKEDAMAYAEGCAANLGLKEVPPLTA